MIDDDEDEEEEEDTLESQQLAVLTCQSRTFV
jgi:hypothetical protein